MISCTLRALRKITLVCARRREDFLAEVVHQVAVERAAPVVAVPIAGRHVSIRYFPFDEFHGIRLRRLDRLDDAKLFNQPHLDCALCT